MSVATITAGLNRMVVQLDDLATGLVSANAKKVIRQAKIKGTADVKVDKLAFSITDNNVEIEAARRIAEKISDLVS